MQFLQQDQSASYPKFHEQVIQTHETFSNIGHTLHFSCAFVSENVKIEIILIMLLLFHRNIYKYLSSYQHIRAQETLHW